MSQKSVAPEGNPSVAAPAAEKQSGLTTKPFIRTVMMRVAAAQLEGETRCASRVREHLDLCGAGTAEGRIETGLTRRNVDLDLIRAQFAGLDHLYPPILSLEQAAMLTGLKEQTLRKHLSEGRYVKSGHPVRFLRDSFVAEFMEDSKL